MALIGTIRKNSWLLIIFIGLGLALFIITSMFVGNQIPFLDSQNSVGKIDGQEIDYNDLRMAEEAYSGGGDIYSTRNYIWNFFVEDALVKKEASALGLAVGEDEKEEMFFGANPNPKIRQFYTNPQTGQFDPTQIQAVKTALETPETVRPAFLSAWNQQTKEAVKDQLQNRLNTMVGKAIFTPTWMVEQAHIDRSQTASFNYVKIPFDEIDNADVTVEDADLKSYLADNKATYYQNEQNRKLDYIVFDVIPSKEDSLDIKKGLNDLAGEYRTSTLDDSEFVENQAGLTDPRFLSREDVGTSILTEALADALEGAEVGAVVGPIVDGNKMKIAKLVDRRVLPDSATSRHILINAATPQEFTAAQVRIDSFKTAIESGSVSFDTLAVKFSQDQGSASKGGVYENVTLNAFVPEYNDIVFYKGEIGKLYSVKSSYGIHLIEPMARKFAADSERTSRIKLTVIEKPIVPSDQTQAAFGDKAQDLMANNRTLESLTQAASDAGYNIEITNPLKANDYIVGTLGSGNTSRDIVRWAFNSSTDVGDVAPEVYVYQDPVEYYDAKYIVVALKNIQEAGNASLADVRDEISPIVYNLKKAEAIKGKITSQDLGAIASSFSSKVDTVVGANFNSGFVSSLGNEPKVLGAAFNLAPNAVSSPVVGNTGVYVVKLNSKTAAGTPNDIPSLRRQTSQAASSQVTSALIQAMKKGAEIKDSRSRFY